MQLGLAPCLQCEQDKTVPQYWVEGAELCDHQAFIFECPVGHKSAIIYDAPKFEILFDMGASALLDGYGREAVSSFAAALERFHEFCIRVFLADQDVPVKETQATWKHVANQSERQLGAFYFLYLLYFKSEPPTNRPMVEFRNKVIHKGYIPTFAQADDFGKYVYDYIINSLKVVRPELTAQIERVCKYDLAVAMRQIPSDAVAKSFTLPTLIGIARPEDKFGQRSFSEAMAHHKEQHRLELERRIERFDDE